MSDYYSSRERKVKMMTVHKLIQEIHKLIQDKIMNNEHRYHILGLILGILGMIFFPEANFKIVIVKYLTIEILSVVLLLLLSDVANPSFYSKLTTRVGMSASISLPILFFIIFFYILNNSSTISSELVSLTFIRLNSIFSFLFGIGVVINFVGTILNRNNIYGFIAFTNLLIFVNTNRMLASFFVSRDQTNAIFSILLAVYVIGLIILFMANMSTKRKRVKREKRFVQ